MRNFGILIASLVVTSPAAPAQDVLQLLQQVAATYSNLPKTAYDFEKAEVRESSGTFSSRSEQRMRIMGSGGRYRQQQLPSGVLYIFDGQDRWSYQPDRNEYTKTSVGRTTGAPMAPPPFLAEFQTVAYRVKVARLLRAEAVDLQSGPVVCQVVEVEREYSDNRMQYSPTTYWIDTNRNLILKASYRYSAVREGQASSPETTVTTLFTRAAMGQPVDESLLRFVPPAGSAQVETLSFGTVSTLVGRQSPEFELKGTDGRVFSSANLRGGAVLLLFAAGSEDESLPFLELAHRSLKSRGLTAVYVTFSPVRAVPLPAQAYTVPVALDPGGAVGKKFGLSYNGTVLIDSQGKIAHLDSLGRDTVGLAHALQKMGVW
jgi:outer membrane lipoprotein-sorting protein